MDPGGPKTYGSYGPGSGFGSGSATLICTLLTCACLPDGHDDAAYVILLVLGGLAQRFPQLQLHKVLQLRVDTPPNPHMPSPSYSFILPWTDLWISGSGSVLTDSQHWLDPNHLLELFSKKTGLV
jgi:hypothetical protein